MTEDVRRKWKSVASMKMGGLCSDDLSTTFTADGVGQCRRDPELGEGREMTTRKVTDGGAKNTLARERRFHKSNGVAKIFTLKQT